MQTIIHFLIENGVQLLYVISTSIITFITIKFKNTYTKYIDDETKKVIAKTCVEACEQLHKESKGEEKYLITYNNIKEILNSKKIKLNDLEMKMLIESFCSKLNDHSDT